MEEFSIIFEINVVFPALDGAYNNILKFLGVFDLKIYLNGLTLCFLIFVFLLLILYIYTKNKKMQKIDTTSIFLLSTLVGIFDTVVYHERHENVPKKKLFYRFLGSTTLMFSGFEILKLLELYNFM